MGTSRVLRLIILSVLYAVNTMADVTPRANVTTRVIIRRGPTTASDRVGSLAPGTALPLVAETNNWYIVKLADGTPGYVSKHWTIATSPEEFSVHFLDVGTGDAAIVRAGTTELVIDGGDNASILARYVTERHLITPPLELLVVTHSDADHWRGLLQLLGYPRRSLEVGEFWEPGYDRACARLPSYDAFMEWMREQPRVRYCRPLTTCYPQLPRRITIGKIAITILHTNHRPTATPCAYTIDAASIVLLIESHGVRFLFAADAVGKIRNARPDASPRYVEADLLTLERRQRGSLHAHVLKVPHHGSETSSTNDFIAAVNPQFVIISASTRQHLPHETVVRRYEGGDRVILRTDVDRRSDNDHIICVKRAGEELECNYEDVLAEID